MSLNVIEPGLYSLIVDGGRPRTRSLGVPLGGAADRAAWMIGNALLGNPPTMPALEMTLMGPTLDAIGEVGMVIFGAPFEVRCEGRTLRAGVPFTLRPGEQVRIGGTPEGARGYLCVVGGFLSPLILGSATQFQPIARGETLSCSTSVATQRHLGSSTFRGLSPVPPTENVLHFLDGAQSTWFAEDALSRSSFTVTPASNRMGVRLKGEPLERRPGELVSEPVAPGTVQVTNDGQCIILGVDGQTIGGYPKVAQIIRADLDRLGQLRPGETIRFVRVTLAEAESRGKRHDADVQEWLTRLSVAELR